MAAYKYWHAATAASVVALGAFIVAAPIAEASSGMSPRGGNSGDPRTEGEAASGMSQPNMGSGPATPSTMPYRGGTSGDPRTAAEAAAGMSGRSGSTGQASGAAETVPYRGGTSGNPRSEADVAAKGARTSQPVQMPAAIGNMMGGSSSSSDSMSSSSMSQSSGVSHRSGMRMNRSDVMSAQKALNDDGARLSVDGKMGPKTRRALMNYQAKNGMTVTGRLDDETAMSLGM